MKQNHFFISIILFLAYTSACATNKHVESQLENGSLLFVSANNQALSQAIDRVTNRTKNANYSHVALVEKVGANFWVIHASAKNGVERISLHQFMKQSKNRNVDVYALKTEFEKSIPKAIETSKTMLGKPYNFSYVLNDSSFYCSDFIERCFAADTIFHLELMTFVNPTTKQIDSVWTAYYQKLGVQVPEGKLGCNPNGLANSTKLHFVKRVQH